MCCPILHLCKYVPLYLCVCVSMYVKQIQSSTEFWKWKKVRAPQLAEKVGDRKQDKRLATLRTFKKIILERQFSDPDPLKKKKQVRQMSTKAFNPRNKINFGNLTYRILILQTTCVTAYLHDFGTKSKFSFGTLILQTIRSQNHAL